MGTARFLRTV
uniref:Uncharacterized protein n=1 Tax=Arundo donax TaxID=35708 RepID=A0A0A9HC79_ARUDO